MKVTAQVFTQKGYYAPPLEFRVRSLVEVSCALITQLKALPDEKAWLKELRKVLEDEKLTDWTRIDIKIDRE